MNLLDQGAAWLGAKLQGRAAGRVVTIEQGRDTLTDITGWVKGHEHEVMDAQEFLTRVYSQDWTFVAADLGDLEFRAGAIVTDSLTGEKFEAMPLGKEPCFRRADSSGILLTLHTKLVATANA